MSFKIHSARDKMQKINFHLLPVEKCKRSLFQCNFLVKLYIIHVQKKTSQFLLCRRDYKNFKNLKKLELFKWNIFNTRISDNSFYDIVQPYLSRQIDKHGMCIITIPNSVTRDRVTVSHVLARWQIIPVLQLLPPGAPRYIKRSKCMPAWNGILE